jgi:hypothetical protein
MNFKILRSQAKRYAKEHCKRIVPGIYCGPSYEEWTAMYYKEFPLNGHNLVLAYEAGFRAGQENK